MFHFNTTKRKIEILAIAGLAGLFSNSNGPALELNGARVFTSSVQGNEQMLEGENTIDGNHSSRWSSEWSDPQWIYYDFGTPRTFDFITILWESAYGKKYEVQVAQDPANWKTVFKEENGDGDEDSIYVGRQESRYLRILGLNRGTGWGYSIYELKVEYLDDHAVPSTPSNLNASANDSMIFLDWDDNSESDLSGYNVYRSAGLNQDLKKLNAETIKTSKYKDKEAVPGKRYYYSVSAVDHGNTESKQSKMAVVTQLHPGKRNFFSIPSAAWKRVLGDLPDRPKSSSPNRGIALGGFGAGSFMYNLSGSFGPFQTFDNVIYKGLWLKEAAFHIYEKIGAGKPRVKTLSLDTNLKPSWDKIRLGDGIYYALQPKGWVTYNCFTTDISQKFFSPIIPHNYRQTSYPVAIWEFKLYNPAQQKAEVSILLTFPAIFVGQQLKADRFKNTFMNQGNIKGVTLRAENGIGEWSLASKESTGVTVSYLTSWDANGDGSDVWNDFAEDGKLKNGALDDSNKAAAIAVNVELNPGQEMIVPLIISWDFPTVKFGSGTEWWKKYTNHFDRDGNNSSTIAKEALKNYRVWEKEIDRWMSPVISNQKYPDWLKRSAFNELYYNQFGGSFYEGGLKSAHRREYMGLHEEDNKYFIMESMAYPFANTFDVRHYSSAVFLYFWPRIEKEILINWSDAILHYDRKDHQTPHDAGTPWNDPYFTWDAYGTNRLHWKDIHSKFIQQCWRYWYVHRDEKFLKYIWPACKVTYQYMKRADTDGDGLPNNNGSDSTYDSWGLWGTSLLCGGLWVGAMESMKEMARIMNDPVELEVTQLLSKAKKIWICSCGMPKMGTIKSIRIASIPQQ